MLDEFISVHRAEIIMRCRGMVAARPDPLPAEAEIGHGVPMFLDQLRDELRHGPSADGGITKTATQHGHDLMVQGCSVSQVVHHYGDVCQAVTQLAVERQEAISAADFQTLNRCLDDAIAGAVTEYGREQSSQRGETFQGAQRGMLTHDLLKAIRISRVAFDAIRSGRVGIGGSTAAVLALGLDTANDLTEQLLAEVPAPAV